MAMKIPPTARRQHRCKRAGALALLALPLCTLAGTGATLKADGSVTAPSSSASAARRAEQCPAGQRWVRERQRCEPSAPPRERVPAPSTDIIIVPGPPCTNPTGDCTRPVSALPRPRELGRQGPKAPADGRVPVPADGGQPPAGRP